MIADKYVYLLLSLGFFIPALLMLRRKEWRKPVIAAGLVGAVAGLFSELLYYVDYWHPPTLRGSAVISVEDALFGFGVAALALCVYGYFKKGHYETWKLNRTHAVHVVILMALVVSLWVVLIMVAHLNSMIASWITFCIPPAFLLVRRSGPWKRMLITGSLLVIIAGVIYAILFGLLDRTYIDTYFLLSAKPWNPALLGFYPLTELVWYFLWGFSAAGVYPYVFDMTRKKVEQ